MTQSILSYIYLTDPDSFQKDAEEIKSLPSLGLDPDPYQIKNIQRCKSSGSEIIDWSADWVESTKKWLQLKPCILSKASASI